MVSAGEVRDAIRGPAPARTLDALKRRLWVMAGPCQGSLCVAPLLGLLGGWFLWWWARQMRFRFRGARHGFPKLLQSGNLRFNSDPPSRPAGLRFRFSSGKRSARQPGRPVHAAAAAGFLAFAATFFRFKYAFRRCRFSALLYCLLIRVFTLPPQCDCLAHYDESP
jgi:hypothetical protein